MRQKEREAEVLPAVARPLDSEVRRKDPIPQAVWHAVLDDAGKGKAVHGIVLAHAHRLRPKAIVPMLQPNVPQKEPRIVLTGTVDLCWP